MSVKGKVVVITGAGSGIGAASARLFGRRGARVLLSDLQPEGARKISEEMRADGADSLVVAANVAKYEEVEALIRAAVNKWGQLDVMVNNAGIGPRQMNKVADHTLEDWDRVIAVNQTGVFYCMQQAIRQMLKQGWGNIVNVASLAGLKASGNNLSYSASKFAVVGMTKSAALEYASANIRINAVCPGYTRTAMLEAMLGSHPDLDKKLLQYVPMRRFGQAGEIAEAILWLASDQTSFITGQTITLDGGTSL